jgi:hypothetical protein
MCICGSLCPEFLRRLQPQISAHVAALAETMRIFQGQQERQRDQRAHSLDLLQQRHLRSRELSECPLAFAKVGADLLDSFFVVGDLTEYQCIEYERAEACARSFLKTRNAFYNLSKAVPDLAGNPDAYEQGLTGIMVGARAWIRNSYEHEKHNLPDLKPSEALEMLFVASYLMRMLVSFATESLTDHPADKKADIIYINEAEGVACIAQGYTAQDWGKQEAPANKASDLNTATAWLLQTPINDVPDAIRANAKLLRDGLTKKTVTKVIFAYAHNALESHNVEKELQAVRHLLNGLDIVKSTDVEVVELGLRQIEGLYLTALGSI